MSSYSDLIAGITQTETGHLAHVTDNWKQGRTTYGGLSATLCVEAALKTLPDAPPLRSGQFAFIGPAACITHSWTVRCSSRRGSWAR